MSEPIFDLQSVRARIDELDMQIQELISQRLALAEDVARAKHKEQEKPCYYRPEREMEVIQKALERNQGRLPEDFVAHLFREIMSVCRAAQKSPRIACLGPQGTYSQAAAFKHFGRAVETLPQPTIGEVFREVEAGNADYGVVPVENSTEGGVNQTLDMFACTRLKICGEIELGIHHCLLSKQEQLSGVKRIYAHQQALAQCRMWLDTHLPNVERLALSSNAEAARRAALEEDAAAVAAGAAADIYDLRILASRIEDELSNTTRFAVLSFQDVPPTGHDKTSVLFATPNQPGALYHMLQPLAENNLSMSRIESRPSRQSMWDYIFFVDFEGHINDPTAAKAMKIIEERGVLFKHLGSYPKSL